MEENQEIDFEPSKRPRRQSLRKSLDTSKTKLEPISPGKFVFFSFFQLYLSNLITLLFYT